MTRTIHFMLLSLLSISWGYANTAIVLWKFEAPTAIIRTGIDYTYYNFQKESLDNFREVFKNKIDTKETINLVNSEVLDNLFEKHRNKKIEDEKVIQSCYKLNIDYLINIQKKLVGATLSYRATSYSTNKTQDLFGTVVLDVEIIETKTGKTLKNFSINNEGLIGSGLPITLFINLDAYLVSELVKEFEKFVKERKSVLSLN